MISEQELGDSFEGDGKAESGWDRIRVIVTVASIYHLLPENVTVTS